MARTFTSESAYLPESRFSFLGKLFSCFLLVLLATWESTLSHPVPQSWVGLRILPHRWQVALELPADRLQFALIQAGPAAVAGGDQRPALTRQVVMSYVADRIGARSDDGTPWTAYVDRALPPDQSTDDWRVTVTLTPPAGQQAKSGWLLDQVILREMATNIAVVSVVEDWAAGVLPNRPTLLGELHGNINQIHVDLRHDHVWRAWLGMVHLGARHVLQGLDHLAFLITLILIVPLRAVAGRWQPLASVQPAVTKALGWGTAFALGHFASLLAASLGWLAAPGPWAEVTMIVFVVLSVAHTIRPLYPHREGWIAGGFGLVHGLAFSTAIRELSLANGQLVLAALGFNLGIELVQLMIVLVLVSLLIVFRERRWMPWLRIALGTAALLAAIWWAVQRIAGL